MINRAWSILFSCCALFAAWHAASTTAHAELNACGGIFLSGDAGCDYRPKQECMTECMTVAVEESCVAQVYAGCESSCTTTASSACESTCTTSCVDSCTTRTMTEQGPSCMDLCLSDCDQDDSDACGRSGYRGACGRCQKHNCEKRCEDMCGDAEQQKKVTTVTECTPTCANACAASCTAKVNTQCQVDCQENTYVSCEQKMVEQCNTQCKDKGGAIFCDGQFVNASNAESCADELKTKLEIDIDIEGAIETVGKTAESVGNTAADAASCVGDKACSVRRVAASDLTQGAWPLGIIAGLAVWRIRRRRSR